MRPKTVGIYANIITRDNVFHLARIARENGVKHVSAAGRTRRNGPIFTSRMALTSSGPTKESERLKS